MKSAGTIIFEKNGTLIFEDYVYPIIIQDIKINNKLKITEEKLEESSGSYKVVDGYEDREVSISCLIFTTYNYKELGEGNSGILNNEYRDFSKDDGSFEEAIKRLEQLEKVEETIEDVYDAIKKIDTIFKKGYVYDIENDFLNSIEIKKLVFTDFEMSLKAGEHKSDIELKFIETDSIRDKQEEMVGKAKKMGIPENKARAMTKAELEKIILNNEYRKGFVAGGGTSF